MAVSFRPVFAQSLRKSLIFSQFFHSRAIGAFAHEWRDSVNRRSKKLHAPLARDRALFRPAPAFLPEWQENAGSLPGVR
jgi:hypothetical protein